jgi:hypothetical protein
VREEQRSGLKAGLIAGIVWAALMTVATVSEIAVYYSSYLSYLTTQYNANETSLGGLTPNQYVLNNIGFNAALTVAVGLAFGALVGYLFISIAPRFLMRQNYMVKGVVMAVFLWLLYELGLTGFTDLYQILTSLAVSLFSGYLLGFLFTKYAGPPAQLVAGEPDYPNNGGASRPGGITKPGSRGSQP